MIAERIATVLLSLWAGSLVTVCGIVAPTLFTLFERQQAGRAAARFFLLETIISVIVCAAVFVLSRIDGFRLPRSVAIALAVGAAAPLISEIVLGPMMQAARDAENMARFGALHGVSMMLFAVACVSSLLAVWWFSRQAK